MKPELGEKQKAILQQDQEMLEDARNGVLQEDFVHNLKPSDTPNPFGFERKRNSGFSTARNVASAASQPNAKIV